MMTEPMERASDLRGHPFADPFEWRVREGLTLAQAEELLDWLDNQGCRDREVSIDPSGVTLHWRYA